MRNVRYYLVRRIFKMRVFVISTNNAKSRKFWKKVVKFLLASDIKDAKNRDFFSNKNLAPGLYIDHRRGSRLHNDATVYVHYYSKSKGNFSVSFDA